MVTQGTSVQPTDVVVTVQVGKMDSRRLPEVSQVCVSQCVFVSVSVHACVSVCACLHKPMGTHLAKVYFWRTFNQQNIS